MIERERERKKIKNSKTFPSSSSHRNRTTSPRLYRCVLAASLSTSTTSPPERATEISEGWSSWCGGGGVEVEVDVDVDDDDE